MPNRNRRPCRHRLSGWWRQVVNVPTCLSRRRRQINVHRTNRQTATNWKKQKTCTASFTLDLRVKVRDQDGGEKGKRNLQWSCSGVCVCARTAGTAHQHTHTQVFFYFSTHTWKHYLLVHTHLVGVTHIPVRVMLSTLEKAEFCWKQLHLLQLITRQCQAESWVGCQAYSPCARDRKVV